MDCVYAVLIVGDTNILSILYQADSATELHNLPVVHTKLDV